MTATIFSAIAFVMVVVLVFYAGHIGKRCPRCKSRLDVVEVKDPFGRLGSHITRIPRLGKVTYRCPGCGTEQTKSELVDASTHQQID